MLCQHGVAKSEMMHMDSRVASQYVRRHVFTHLFKVERASGGRCEAVGEALPRLGRPAVGSVGTRTEP